MKLSLSKNKLNLLPGEALRKQIAILLLIAIIGLTTVRNYGLSYDEPTGIATVKWNYDYIKTRQSMPNEIYYYDGTIFNFAAESIYQAQKLIRERIQQNPTSNPPSGLSVQAIAELERSLKSTQSPEVQLALNRIKGREILARVQVKHPVTFLASLIAYCAVIKLVEVFCGAELAWIGAISLTLFPRFWGYSFFNFKDIPFAAVFTFTTLIGTYLVRDYLNINCESQIHFKLDRLVVQSIFYGAVVGVLAGIRVGGIIAICFPLIAYCVVQFSQPHQSFSARCSQLLKVLGYSTLSLLICLVITIACYPTAWFSPISWLLNAGRVLSKYAWGGTVLFNGQIISGQQVPWSYIPTWFTITVPVFLQLTFLLGLFWLVARYSKLAEIQKAGFILLLLQILVIPLTAIVKQSTIYDEIRHFLFIFPAIAVILTVGLIWSYQSLPVLEAKLVAIAAVAVISGSIYWDLVALHPYEYVYFNRASGGIAKLYERYETDFWGLSARAAMEWVNQNGDRRLPVLVGANLWSASIYAASDIEFLRFSQNSFKILSQQSKPFYYLAIPSGNYQFQNYFAECPLVHQVTRQSAPLTTIRQCSSETIFPAQGRFDE